MKKLFILFTLLFSMFILNAQVLSDFEDGTTEGWRSEGDGDYTLETGTGNSGDCLRINDYATGAMNYAIAPLKFTGDWSVATENDSIHFDLKVITSAGYVSNQWTFEISGTAGMARHTPPSPNPPTNIWTYYSVFLDSTQWDIISGDWNSILSDVDLLRIRAEYINGDEYILMDNISLSFTPTVNPVLPLVITDFENGSYDGWYFKDSGSTAIESDTGNPDYCCKINDQSGVTSQAIAPPKFLGDWSQLDESAAFIIDIKTNQSTVIDVGYLIKITGPGGEAIIPVDSALSEAYNEWKSFSYMISESVWTINTGNWNDILNNIEELNIAVEYSNATDVVRIDNIKIYNDPPIAQIEPANQYSCIGESVQFYDNSTNAPTSWLWDFGDGNTSVLQNPEHIYTTSGFFDVQLTATNTFGSNTITLCDYLEVTGLTDYDLYSDNFDDNNVYPAWDFINGTWTETSGEMRQTSNYYSSGWVNGCYATAGCDGFHDYELEVDLYSTDDDGIGAVIYFEDIDNFYLFVWRKQTSERALYKYVNGVETELASDAVAYTSNTWYNLKFSNLAGNIVCTIDDIDIFNVTDTSLTMGKAGLYCWANQSSYWDNFSITNIGVLPKPLNVVITENFDQIEISWNAVSGATSYSVYSSSDPNADPTNWSLEQSGITVTNWSETATGNMKFYYVKAVQ